MTLAEYLKYKMKKFILIFIVAIVLVSLSSCTEQIRTRELGGQMTIELPKGQELMMVTWKDNDLFYLTRPMSPDYVPVTKTFQESASWGVLESTVYFKESR
jgi:hypothetical protein